MKIRFWYRWMLFTNVPIDKVIENVSQRWNYISDNVDIPQHEFILAVKFVLNSTFFTFDGVTYQQTFGTPMGSPLSPLIADIVLQDLETRALNSLRFSLPFYVRYVDDITLAIPSNAIEHTLNIFNSFHDRLQFTLEESINNRLDFLDITIIVENNRLIFDWFHKKTFSGRYLNFYSQYPICQKRGTVIGLIDKTIFLSHPKFHSKNFKMIIGILLENCYPLEFIFKTFQERLKFLFSKDKKVQEDLENNEKLNYFTIPFINEISENFRSILKDYNTKTAFCSLNKLNIFIKAHKDSLPKSSINNVSLRKGWILALREI